MVMKTVELKFNRDVCEISGYASLWNGAPDAYGDIVSKGAFRASLTHSLPEMKREHTGPAIGRWLSAVEDQTGLKISGEVTDPQTIADLRSGNIDGLSIGFVEKKSTTDGQGHRILEEVDLQEVSLVKRPAKNSTRVLSIKSCPNRGKTKMATNTDNTAGVDNCDPAEDADTENRLATLETSVADISGRLEKLEGVGAKQVKSLAGIEAILRRPGGASIAAAPAGETETKAFSNFCRRGIERLENVEQKSLRISDDTSGGYLAPNDFVRELLRNLVLTSPVRQIARVSTTGAANVVLPKRTAALTATWTAETATVTGSQSAYGQAQFPVAELACYTDISNSLLEDAAFDIGSELAFDFAEQFGKSEGAAFVNGDGVGKPRGFMQDSSVSSVNSGSASAITADSLLNLYHALPTFYSANAVWGMNRTTLGEIRKLKDSNNRYLLSFDGIPNAPALTLLGRPIVELPDMPDIAGGAFPVIFGDFKQGYRIFDRVSLAVLRDPYSVQTTGLVRFHARRRVAGGIAKSEALKTLKISA